MERSEQSWLLYDDECGVCHKTVPFFRETLRKQGFSIAPLRSDWVRKRLGIAEGERQDYLRLLLPDGKQVLGADAYRYVMQRVWWSWPIYLLSVLPLLRGVFDWGYRTFANNRYWVSKVCGLPGAGERGRLVGDSGDRIESSQQGKSGKK